MSRQSLVDKIIALLDEEILSGKILPGQRISELEIARRLEVSRAPVREAFIHLEERGLIESNRGQRRVKSITEEDIKEVAEVIVMLETYCALKALERGREFLQELERILLQLEEYSSKKKRKEYMIANFAFHDVIIQASGNKALIPLYRDFVRRFRWRALVDYSEYMDHRDLFEALKAGDRDGVMRLIASHRNDFLKTLLSKIKRLKKLGATAIRGLNLG
jgi:DNA-binding GntR family transcriptional regulator